MNNKIIEGESWVFFDVDGTLVCETEMNPFTVKERREVFARRHAHQHYGLTKSKGSRQFVLFYNPYTAELECMEISTQHARLMRHMKNRGRQILVWSANGVRYAERAVMAMGLDGYVTNYISKPLSCVDDLEPNQFLKQIFLKRGTR